MMKFEGAEVSKLFKAVFGTTVDVHMMGWLIKVIKHCRGRCRSNAALKNYLARSFPDLVFGEVEKTGKFGKPYKALTFAPRTDPKLLCTEAEEGDEE